MKITYLLIVVFLSNSAFSQSFSKLANEGVYYLSVNKYEEANSRFLEAFEIEEHSRLALYIGFCYFKMGRNDSALEYLLIISDINPPLKNHQYKFADKLIEAINDQLIISRSYRSRALYSLHFTRRRFNRRHLFVSKKQDKLYKRNVKIRKRSLYNFESHY